MCKLTIGMASCNNTAEVWFTVQALRMYQDLTDTEILVIDNGNDKQLKQFIDSWCCHQVRYVKYDFVKGSAPAKNAVFDHAEGEWVLCIDSHVFLAPGSVKRFREWCDGNQSKDLFHGPMLYDNLTSVVDAMNDEWRGHMWGTWRGGDCLPDDDCYEIPMHGMGLFACRRDAWLGFNHQFKGFGAEEGYIHTKFKQAGRKIILLPFMRWLHRFKDKETAPFPCTVEDRVHNYLVGFRELGLDPAPIKEQFGEAMVEKVQGKTVYMERTVDDNEWQIKGNVWALDQKFRQPNMSKIMDGLIWEQSLSSKNLGMLLPGFVVAMQAKNIIEIGVGQGFTTQCLARALAGLGRGLLVSIDIDQNACDNARKMGVVAPKHEVTCGDTKTINIPQYPYDFAFIDGDHSYDGCYNDLCKVIPLMTYNCTIVVHDYNNVTYPGVVQAVDKFAKDNGFQKLIIPVCHENVDEGVAILQRWEI